MTTTDTQTPKLFVLDQKLSVLTVPPGESAKKYLDGDRFWHEHHKGRGGDELPDNPWKDITRKALVEGIVTGKYKRLAVVCRGGYGKSWNLVYLRNQLKLADRVPFLYELDGLKARDLRTFWSETLLREVSGAPHARQDIDPEEWKHLIEDCRVSGQFAFLFDSIDQASENGLQLVQEFLANRNWDGCPVVISARPHAIFDNWKSLVVPDESAWKFVRVEPLAVPEREFLLGPEGMVPATRRAEGAKLYKRLPPAGHDLMENPRNIKYVRDIAGKQPASSTASVKETDRLTDYRLENLRTASHLFAGAVDNMVENGFAAEDARRLGLKLKKSEAPPEKAETWQQPLALDLLSAIAYAMYCHRQPGQDPDKPFKPNVSHIPVEGVSQLLYGKDGKGGVKQMLTDAEVPNAWRVSENLESALKALSSLNAKMDFCLLDRSTDSGLRWHDRTLQEFLAAWWLARYATDDDANRLRSWRYDNRMKTEKSLYAPLWGFLVEMPLAVRTDKWFTAVSVLFEHKSTRCCEMIYRCWPSLEQSKKGNEVISKWQKEFQSMTDEVAVHLRTDFVELAKPGSTLPNDTGRFEMGSPETEEWHQTNEVLHSVSLSRFRIWRTAVTNEQYELFDPGHENEREWETEKDIAKHPVVYVDWWEAWCFAWWVGGKLPTEAQWEYAARGGSTTPFYWGNSLNVGEANFRNHPYGASNPGDFKNRTTAVGDYANKAPLPHPWGLHDIHGNVLEWCSDWIGPYVNDLNGAEAKDPIGPVSGMYRVYRGGCWNAMAKSCSAWIRGGDMPESRVEILGFRLAAGPSEPSQSPEAERNVGAEPAAANRGTGISSSTAGR
ncbi:MAG: formylglycine-generating enzyme family protein [Gemmataceae bacterium]|nr:formylglycine-generating enzyme family protein [Gemmataceae bacterium]